MPNQILSRREALARTGILAGASLLAGPVGAHAAEPGNAAPAAAASFRFCLNLATIRGHKLGIVKEVEIAARAGYQGIEPWVDTISDFTRAGGKLGDLRRQITDAGLAVEGAIAFPEWIVDDEDRRTKAMERAKREMDLVSQIGAKRFAAPPAGGTNLPKLDVLKVAERYRALLELGEQFGLVAEFELWGFSQNFNRLGECVWVAMETGHPKACVLADVFHLYKGGSDWRGFRLLGPDTVPVIHMNDYPADPPRERINDGFRIHPGRGTAPLPEILRALTAHGGTKVLSLELFNNDYYKQDPLEVAKAGLAGMKAQAEKALA